MKTEEFIKAYRTEDEKIEKMKKSLICQIKPEAKHENVIEYFNNLECFSDKIPNLFSDLKLITRENIHKLTIGDKFPSTNTKYVTNVKSEPDKGAAYLILNFILDEKNIITDIKYELLAF